MEDLAKEIKASWIKVMRSAVKMMSNPKLIKEAEEKIKELEQA